MVVIPQSPAALIQLRDTQTRVPDGEAAQPAGKEKVLIVVAAVGQSFPEVSHPASRLLGACSSSMQQEEYKYLGKGVRKITSLPARRVRNGRQFLKNM